MSNPDVVVPDGDFNSGKALFEDLCKSCHKMRVIILSFRVTGKVRWLLPLEVFLEDELGLPNTTIVML